MDPRTAAHTLSRIADLQELRGETRFKVLAYRNAARAISALTVDDIGPLYRSGALERMHGLGPATLAVLRDLVETGESEYLEQLREDTPEGLFDMMRVPGLGAAKIHRIHTGLGIETLHELEEAARDGRLAALPTFGPTTAAKVLKGIAYLRDTCEYVLYPHAAAEAARLLAMVRGHPGVVRAEVAGSVRRRREIVRDIDIVAACSEPPAQVATVLARAPGVRDIIGKGGASVTIRFVDGTLLDLHCVTPERFAVAFWRATGSAAHEREVVARAAARGITIADDQLVSADGAALDVPDEAALYRAAGLPYIEPELREGRGEVDAALAGSLPSLITARDIRGVLHCHSRYSDGKASIAELAAAARERGWSYVGISDHSQSAFYAGGLSREAVREQHVEIDRVNADMEGVRVLKGIEADILACGRLDYEPELLDEFDFVIGSVHSRFGMERGAMTARILRALEDPHLTILGHPTGRLLLTREPYAVDVDAVLEKAAAMGVAVELNADPHRLDLDWTYCQRARALGVTVEIGPDAHSVHGLDNVELGVGIARKGWLSADDVLNTQPAEAIVERARRRRAGAGA